MIPKSKYNVGDPVFAKDETAGHPPEFAATIVAVEWVKESRLHLYTVVEDAAPTFGTVDLYTEDWLSPRPISHPPGEKSPNDEAVKAAFAFIENKSDKSWRDMQPFLEPPDSEFTIEAAPRILAAHARATQAEADRLRAALERELSIKKERLVQLKEYLRNNPQYWENLDGFVTHLIESSKRIGEALAGKDGAE